MARQRRIRGRQRGVEPYDAARQRLGTQNGTAALAPYDGATGRLRADWPTLDLDKRRAVLGALIARIVISPATVKGAPADRAGRRVFEPRRVQVEWRF